MTSEVYRELLASLRKPLYVDRLWKMAAECRQLAEDNPDKRTCLVLLWLGLGGLARQWDDRPLVVEYAAWISERVGPAAAKALESNQAADIDDLSTALLWGLTQDPDAWVNWQKPAKD
jgi:hypothetical protein